MELWINCSIKLGKVKCIIQPLHILCVAFIKLGMDGEQNSADVFVEDA